jgi:hypothetical protein
MKLWEKRKMPVSVIRNVGRAKTAKLPNGETVERADRLLMQGDWMPCLDTDNHFVYKTKNLGSAMMCTCGASAVAVGYHEYKKYASYMGNEVIMCYSLAQRGIHNDGSH